MIILAIISTPPPVSAAPEPKAFGVFVGVARHNTTNPEKNLDYSDNSAYQMSLKLQEWRWVDESYLFVTPDPDGAGGAIPPSAITGNASWENVEAALASLSARAGPADYFIFFFNGHSYDNGLKFSGEAQYPGTSVSYATLFDRLDRVACRYPVLVLDTCALGSAVAARDRASRSYCLLGAASGTETSWQAAQWGMGYFTHSLLELYQGFGGNCSITQDFDSMVPSMKNDTRFPQTPFASDPFSDRLVNFKTRFAAPVLGISFATDASGKAIHQTASGANGAQMSFTVKLVLTNNGTATAYNISIALRDSSGSTLGTASVAKLPYNSSADRSINITLSAGEDTGPMSASASASFDGENVTAQSLPGEGAEASITLQQPQNQWLLCGLLGTVFGLAAAAFALAVWRHDKALKPKKEPRPPAAGAAPAAAAPEAAVAPTSASSHMAASAEGAAKGEEE